MAAGHDDGLLEDMALAAKRRRRGAAPVSAPGVGAMSPTASPVPPGEDAADDLGEFLVRSRGRVVVRDRIEPRTAEAARNARQKRKIQELEADKNMLEGKRRRADQALAIEDGSAKLAKALTPAQRALAKLRSVCAGPRRALTSTQRTRHAFAAAHLARCIEAVQREYVRVMFFGSPPANPVRRACSRGAQTWSDASQNSYVLSWMGRSQPAGEGSSSHNGFGETTQDAQRSCEGTNPGAAREARGRRASGWHKHRLPYEPVFVPSLCAPRCHG